MQVISIQNIQDRPIIDAIAPQDFLLIGDASDGNQVKRVLVSEFIADDDKLAIADYSFNTIPGKPTTYPHGVINWGEVQGKPTVFAPDTHSQPISTITGLLDVLDLKLDANQYTWDLLPDKPLTFPPSDHSHSSRLPPIQTNGNSFYEFDVPPWAIEIQVAFSNMSVNGTNAPRFQLGTLSGIETTGYLGGAARVTAFSYRALNNSDGFLTSATNNLPEAVEHGIAFFTLVDPLTNTWAFSVNTARSDAAAHSFAAGAKALSGGLRRVRLTTNSADIFDNGVIAPSFK